MTVGYASVPGEFLPNGAMLLAQQKIKEQSITFSGQEATSITFICLCFYSKEFVTWEYEVAYKKGDSMVMFGQENRWGHYFRHLGEAWNNYQLRIKEHMDIEKSTEIITKRATEDGTAAASWIDSDELSYFVAGIAEGDPEVMDKLPRAGLSGEFTDDPPWDDVFYEELSDELGFEREDIPKHPLYDSMYELYLTKFDDAVENTIHERARLYDTT